MLNRKTALIGSLLLTIGITGCNIMSFSPKPDFCVLQEGTYWSNTYQGPAINGPQITLTSDGGYIVAGYSTSGISMMSKVAATFKPMPNEFNDNSSTDLYVLKFDTKGGIEWQYKYSWGFDEYPISIEQTQDKGYSIIVSGQPVYSYENNKYKTYKLKLDSKGEVEASKAYAGKFTSVQSLQDNGSIMHSGNDLNSLNELIKLDKDDKIEWQKSYEILDSANKNGSSKGILPINKGYMSFGYLTSGFQQPRSIYLLNLDLKGNILWQKSYGGNGSYYPELVEITPDGGYIIGGYSHNNDDDDIYLLKINSAGEMEWQKKYGGSYYERLRDIEVTVDGGYIVLGETSFDSQASYSWLLKVTDKGAIEWQKTYGKSNDGELEIKDKNYIIANVITDTIPGKDNNSLDEFKNQLQILNIPPEGCLPGLSHTTNANPVITNAVMNNIETTVKDLNIDITITNELPKSIKTNAVIKQ